MFDIFLVQMVNPKKLTNAPHLEQMGIYIHIPFCRQACHYCNFHFSTNLNSMDELIDAICLEIKLKSNRYDTNNITSIYFGGGTPSLLSYSQLKKIVHTLEHYFDVENLEEFTIECNPEDIDNQTCDQFKDLGVNRVSLGIQSFHDEDLKYMNRNHNAKKGIEAIDTLLQHNFSNLSVDLIYGTPTLNLNDWLNNLEIVSDYNIPHVSCYALTVEEGTALPYMIKNKKRKAPDDEVVSQQFLALREKLLAGDYEHYEVSNFARQGFRAKHNTSYWNGSSYLGFGPGAHSYDGKKRYWNISHNIKYIKSIRNNAIPEEVEYLSDQNLFNEQIMTSLRTSEGLDVQLLQKKHKQLVSETFYQELQHLIDEEKAMWRNNHIILTEKGLLLCDQISSNLFTF